MIMEKDIEICCYSFISGYYDGNFNWEIFKKM